MLVYIFSAKFLILIAANFQNFQNRCAVEPPACVQNAMMTKDKKPFTYTPGGLDLSQIRTPSMARRLNRQQQQMDDQDNPSYQMRTTGVNGGPPAPPPPPMAPPPPPPLVININKSPKTVQDGERPEIVIPENPIGMLRKTHSPYHWESEQADRLQQGAVPKFVGKSATPSPAVPQMRMQPPRQFSQQPPQQTVPNSPIQQQQQQIQQQFQQHNKSPSTSPIWKPEPKYPNNASPQSTPSVQQTPTKDILQRQDSQFNHSPSPWNREPPFSNSSSRQTFSPSADTNSIKSPTPASNAGSPWRQERVESPAKSSPYQVVNNSPRPESFSPAQQSRSPMSPPAQAYTVQSPQQNSPQPIYNNVNRSVQSPEMMQKSVSQQNVAPWRQESKVQQQPIVQSPIDDQEVRYQTHMMIPVKPRQQKPNENQPEIPFSPKVVETPKASLPWVQNAANKSDPTPPWCVRSESRRSLPRDVPEQTEQTPVQPPWNQSATLGRQPSQQPQWRNQEQMVQRQDNGTLGRQNSQQQWKQQDQMGGQRVIPVQMEVSKNEIVHNQQGKPQGRGQQQPQLRIIIDMNQQGKQPGQQQPNIQYQQPQQQYQQQQQQYQQQQQLYQQPQQQYQQPQQQITRVVQPQIMRMDPGMMSPQPSSGTQPKTRIIPIQMEPSSPVVTSPRYISIQ